MTVRDLKKALEKCDDNTEVAVVTSNGYDDTLEILSVRLIEGQTLYGNDEDHPWYNRVFLDVTE